MKFTFYGLIKDYQITIPLIQRDYAQGRETAETIRNNFTAKLLEVITAPPSSAQAHLHLDFIYGYTESNTHFIPLDGQQRLTTLFLLHWYLATKEGLLDDQPDYSGTDLKKLLSRFSYQTRLSSQRFCEKLVNKKIALDTTLLSVRIIDQPWFMSAWKDDPTIQSMLNMLDTIHVKFRDCPPSWNKLVGDGAITFEFIDIKSEKFRLTDELYIKMNSRGKPLTPFENFKAEFIDLLKQPLYDDVFIEYEKSKLSYKDYFSIRIDGKWMDLFWNKRSVIKPDDGIINYLTYITEMLFYKNHAETENFSFAVSVKEVYQAPANALFLFNSLDMLAGQDDTSVFFDSIFSTEYFQSDRVCLFEPYTTDLFRRSLNGTNFDIRSRILFYALLHYVIELKPEDQNKLKDFLRIVRNLLSRIRQINTRKKIEYTSNLRLPNFNDYSQFIHEFVETLKKNPGEDIYQVFLGHQFKGFSKNLQDAEKTKAAHILKDEATKHQILKLEDHYEVRGITDNFSLNDAELAKLVDTVYGVWHPEMNNALIIRAMLTFGDFSVQTQEHSRMGSIWYFGSKDYWNRILATTTDEEPEKISKILGDFLNTVSRMQGSFTERLSQLKDSYHGPMDFKYYFIKYNQITSSYYERFNLYTWADESGFDINSLGNSGQHPLASYHLNPYLIVLEKELNNVKKVELNYGRFSDEISHIRIKGKVQVFCQAEGWYLGELSKGKITPELISNYQLEERGKGYLFRADKTTDRIQLALQFCRELIG